MKKYALALCAVLPLLGACNWSSTNATIKTIGQVAANSLPVACQIFGVAKGYFTDVMFKNSPNNITLGEAAIAGVEGICANPNNPPITVEAALVDLNAAWVALEAATTVPTVPLVKTPTPTPTSN